jgi:voltage-gated potassium channel
MASTQPHQTEWRKKLYIIIFEAETPLGKAFDVALIWTIMLSIAAVILESVEPVRLAYSDHLKILEWFFTIIFTLEYIIRLMAVRNPFNYARSFFGVVDLLAILPTFISLFISGAQLFLVIRAIRLLRVFRIFKLKRYMGEADILIQALSAARHKITVFLGSVLIIALIVGSMMYLIEGPEAGYINIPMSMYWSIVTMTTVGYGDLVPTTPLGQFMASLLMIIGYGIIAVPTGIVTAEIAQASRERSKNLFCSACGAKDHLPDAVYCRKCQAQLS